VDINYNKKYIKYKLKYLKLKNKLGGNKLGGNKINNLGFDIKNNLNIHCVDLGLEKNDCNKLICLARNFFEKDVLAKLKNYPRPITQLYGDFVERKPGRFEIIPCSNLIKEIYKILNKSDKFVMYNNLARNEIKRLTGEDVTEELCLLPVEMSVSNGNFHRDIFVKSPMDFIGNPFYITHLIYLDNISSTEFCLGSQTNSNDNPDNYEKITIQSGENKMVLFDGRIIHRGLENKSDRTRYALYISYYKKSYIDDETILPKFFDQNDKICKN
jgi:hypothetical protein